jgi:hypothetical protein
MGTDRIFSGSMNYPEGQMKYIWDGRGTRGPSAHCSLNEAEVRIAPLRVFERVLGWPDIVVRRQEIRHAERLFAGRIRFRSSNTMLDGACFRPYGSSQEFAIALADLGIAVEQPSWRTRLRAEVRMLWNQVRWGGRLRR